MCTCTVYKMTEKANKQFQWKGTREHQIWCVAAEISLFDKCALLTNQSE